MVKCKINDNLVFCHFVAIWARNIQVIMKILEYFVNLETKSSQDES